ncbi:sensor histidine kinase [Jiangella mangrovi]|uniref:Two-component system sensor histidine kinase DesK n=1 Tax=Jiangella mangrovi TaxID=1524084 RepID=A0A7W9GUR0_9ACTN|nr:histidine kinase [Jiangella mangrovi]MBB5790427.1 two-component system sensor histidine kinase DesK [Jiangella mangrovi]
MSESTTARRVVLAILLGNAAWVVVIPWRMVRPPTPVLDAAFAAGLLAVAIVTGMMLRSAATARDGARGRARVRRTPGGAAVLVTLGLWWPAYQWAVPGDAPWAWLAGMVAGAVALALPWTVTAGVVLAHTGAATAGALAFGTSVLTQVLTVWGAAAAVVVMLHALVWLLGLLHDSERARESEAALAVAEERLRMSRELHDLLGHRLTVIALKAELAAGLTGADPEQARAETDEIRQVAAATLGEVRRAVQGETVSDLRHQLESARLVLSSAGVRMDVALEPLPLTAAESALLAAVVREGVTNVLRHARATEVRIRLEATRGGRTFGFVNDDAGGAASGTGPAGTGPAGTGLAGLAIRCADLGATLTAGPTDGDFELRVDLPA